MLSSKITAVFLLSFLSGSFAIPTPQNQTTDVTGVNRTAVVDWLPVDVINDIPIYINSAAIANISINPVKRALRSLNPRIDWADRCRHSSFLPHPGPYATTAHCWSLHDYAARQVNTYMTVQGSASSQGWLIWAGDCKFYAGTQNVFATYIGLRDISDVTRDSIMQLQWNGIVAAQGQMGCDNNNIFDGLSNVHWTLMRNL